MFQILAGLFFSVFAQAEHIVLTQNNHCVIQAAVDYESMQDAKLCLGGQVTKRGRANYPIYLVLDTPGGSVIEGLRFIEWAKTLPNVHTVSLFAASMGSGIMQALPGKRYVTSTSVIMFHRAKGRFSGQFEDGEVESQLILWKKIVRSMEQANADRIGISLKTYKQKVVNEWWLYGQENVTKKVADKVVTVACSATLMSDVKTVKIETFLGPLEMKVSACPLFN
jgi:ATP-dependent protease ClpP protease subunit